MSDPVLQHPFFRPDAAPQFRQPPGTPYFLRADSDLGRLVGDPGLAGDWAEKQAQLMRWTRDSAMFNEAEVMFINRMYEGYFAKRGFLRGNVLDIGGGWGLFRQWWRPEGEQAFVVHDPGTERFMAQPPPTLKKVYADGLARSVRFVEGFGEELPYLNGCFDLVLIASALDHCADPVRVLAETRRVLRPGGTLMVIQGFDAEPGEPRRPGTDLGSRLARVLSDPRRLYRAVKQRILHRGEPHIHHFTRNQLVNLVAEAGFFNCRETVLERTHGVSVFEAGRP